MKEKAAEEVLRILREADEETIVTITFEEEEDADGNEREE